MSTLLNHSKDDDCMWHEGVADVYRCTYEGRCKNGKDCVTGKECERCGGSGMLRKCNQTECFEYGCCGDGTCEVRNTPPREKAKPKFDAFDILTNTFLVLAVLQAVLLVAQIIFYAYQTLLFLVDIVKTSLEAMQ